MKKSLRTLTAMGALFLGSMTIAPAVAYANPSDSEVDGAGIYQDQENPDVPMSSSEEEVEEEMLAPASSSSSRYCQKVSNPYSFFKEYDNWRAYQTVKEQYYLSCASAPEESASDPLSWNGYRNGAVHPDDLVFTNDVVLREDAAEAYERMNAAYKAETGKDLQVNSSYRSYSKQVTTWITSTPIAAYPGTSGHGWGTSLDLATAGDYEAQGEWLKEHSEEYGWINPAWAHDGKPPEESWHFDFKEPSTPVICDNIFQKKQDCNQL